MGVALPLVFIDTIISTTTGKKTMGSPPRLLGEGGEVSEGGLFCARTSAGLWTNPLTLSHLRAMGSDARNETTSYIAGARPTAADPPNDPRPPGGAFPYMRQHANTIAKATVDRVFAAVPGLKNAARANYAGAPPPEDTWNQIGDFPWQPVHRDWLQPYGAL
jgi:hypothetical protein